MKKVLAPLLAILLMGFVPSKALSQGGREYIGLESQRCPVINCNTPNPSPGAPSNSSERAEHNARAERSARYDKINKDAVRVWREATGYASFNAKMDAYQYALELFSQQQALRDGPNVQEAIAQVKALIHWTSGVINDQHRNYSVATRELLRAYNSRPELFSEGNFNYIAAVELRSVKSLAAEKGELQRTNYSDPTLVDVRDISSGLPESVVKAIAGAFSDAPEGVSDRVRKGFQAVMIRDWKVARAWFQDALNHDPGNVNLQRFIDSVDQPADQTSARLRRDRHTDFARNPLTTLSDTTTTLSKEQIKKVLDAIIVEASCPDCRPPREKP